MINRLILTGLHKCGKSTFINNICSKNHSLSTIRLNTKPIMENMDKFDVNTYLNFFNIYDRFLFIDLFVYYRFDIEMFIMIFTKLKPYYKNSLFVFGLFYFENYYKNYDIILERYNIIIDKLKKLGYNVLIFKDKKSWIKFCDKFDSTKITDIDKSEYVDFKEQIITNEYTLDYLENKSKYSTYYQLIKSFLDVSYIENSFDYIKTKLIDKNNFYIPSNITSIKNLKEYIGKTYGKWKEI